MNSCESCTALSRRGFLSAASVLSMGAWLTACGDGVIDGPANPPALVPSSVRIDLANYPSLGAVGGRAIVAAPGAAPMMVHHYAPTRFRAWSLECPHHGTIVNETRDGFLCPNHHARFSAEGAWVGGTPTSDLSPVAVIAISDAVLEVGGAFIPPAMSVSQNAMSFYATRGSDAPSAQIADITNVGGGYLDDLTTTVAYAAGQSTGWLRVALTAPTAPSFALVNVQADALPAGAYAATVTIASPTVGASAHVIRVTLVVSDPNSAPSLQFSRYELALNTTVGSSPAAQTVLVLNTGAGVIADLVVSIEYGAGARDWLSSTSLSGSATPSQLTVRSAASALPAGTYTATVRLSGSGGASRTMPVTLIVASFGLAVRIADWPTLASVGGVAGSVGTINFGSVAVVRTSATTFDAYSLICPHAGATVLVDGTAAFRCPRHGATWNGDGSLKPASPIRTAALTKLRVTYTPGDGTLYVGGAA